MELKREHKKVIEAILLLFFIVFFVFFIKMYFTPFLWICITLLLSNPIYNLLLKFKISNKLSALLSLLLLNLTLALTLYYLGRNIFELLMDIYRENINIMNYLILEFNDFLENVFGNVNISNEALKLISPDFITKGAINTGEGIVSYFIGNICTFFILVDKKKIINYIFKAVPNNTLERIDNSRKNIKKIIVVQSVLVITSTIITIIGFKILGIKESIILGIICGILDLLPYVGTIIVFIPIIIYNIIIKNYLISFGLICLYILIQILRELLEMKLLSNKLNMHPLIMFISVYIGIKVFGIIGIIIGTIYSIMVKDIFCNS